MGVAGPRFPLEPVAKLLHAENADDIALRLGVSRRTVQRWLAKGVPMWSADPIAIEIGYMPYEVWPEWGRTEGA